MTTTATMVVVGCQTAAVKALPPPPPPRTVSMGGLPSVALDLAPMVLFFWLLDWLEALRSMRSSLGVVGVRKLGVRE